MLGGKWQPRLIFQDQKNCLENLQQIVIGHFRLCLQNTLAPVETHNPKPIGHLQRF